MGTGAEPRRWRLRAGHSTLSGARAWPIVVGGPTFGFADGSVTVVEAASVEADLQRLREQNDGLYTAIQLAQNEQERLRRIETAARRLIEVDTTDAEAGPEFDSMWVRLRAALGEPSNA